jgi:hypothetical protein
MINLGHANAVGTGTLPSWQEAAREAGLDPSALTPVWAHLNGGKAPENAIAFFRVRSRDPAWYLVPVE